MPIVLGFKEILINLFIFGTGSLYVAAVLELTELCLPLGLKVCTTTTRLCLLLFI